MKKTLSITTIFLLSLTLQAADYLQEPGHFGGFGSDNTFAVADEFQFSEDTQIKEITWWGGYGDPQPKTDHFTIRIFADNFGEPGALLMELTPDRIKKNRTGHYLLDEDRLYPEYRYRIVLDTPFAVEGGVKYWISIVSAPEDNWSWEVSGSLENLGVQRSVFTDPVFGPWTPYFDNTAFELKSVADNNGHQQ